MSESFHQCSILMFILMPLLTGEAAQLGNLSDIWKHWTKKQALSYCLFPTSLRHPHTVCSTILPLRGQLGNAWEPSEQYISALMLPLLNNWTVAVSLSRSPPLNLPHALWVQTYTRSIPHSAYYSYASISKT